MTRRIQITLLSLLMSVCAMASYTSVKNSDGVDIWYNFNSSTKTASVTYRGIYSSTYSNEYTGNVVIPSTVTYDGVEYSVTSIGVEAFRGCNSLTSITLPKDLTSIGGYAFYYCSALTSITIPEGVTLIGYMAFSGCSALTSITLPEGVTSIGDRAFSGCYKLYEVYNKSDLTITAGSTDNGYVAYYAKNVYTDSEGESKLKTVGDYIFYVDGEDIELIAYTGGETSITLPSDYEGKNYNIGDYAFYNCDALTSITLPEGLTSIGNSAFENCDALRSITLPEGVTSIEEDAFYECDALTSITLPESLTSIGHSAFEDCDALRSITLPEGVTSIGSSAFYDCSALTRITSKNTTPPTIGSSYTFYDVKKSIPVYVPKSSVDAYKSAEYWKDFTNIVGKYYIVDIEAENGTVEGAGTYMHGDKATLTATPAEGYKFVQWSDGVTDNPRTVVVVSDMTFTAEFELKEYTLTTEAENGTVEGAGTYKHGDKAKLTATPAEGYKFVQWSDGVTDNSRTIVVVSDMTFTAKFELKEYTLTTEAENGTVEGAGTYKHGDEATLTATPAEGYKFVQWSDGVTDNPRTVVVTSDMTFTAEFELKEYTLTTEAENGTIEGAGTYKHGDKATLTATPAEGYKFVKWSDGVTDNPRTVVVVSDMTLTAKFEIKEYTLTTEAENGTVEGAGTYKHGDKASLTATPAEGYKFVQWSDGVTDNSRTIVVVSDMTFTAEFELKEYTLTTEAENGTVEGAGTYKHGDKATLTATPAEGYKFVQWSDGVTDNPRTIEVTSDLTLTAEFEIDVTPISDIQISDVKVRLIGNEIAVEGADDYTVYSISGQNLGKAEIVERGIYIVVANGKCYKVIAK